MRSLVSNQRGFTTMVIAIFMPVLLAFLALCADGAVLIFYRISLETAADAASLAAIDSYDRDIWYSETRIVLREEIAEQLVLEILMENIPEARLVKIEVPALEQNTCIVEAEVDAPLHFLQIFGIDAKTVTVTSLAHGYD